MYLYKCFLFTFFAIGALHPCVIYSTCTSYADDVREVHTCVFVSAQCLLRENSLRNLLLMPLPDMEELFPSVPVKSLQVHCTHHAY